jgi:protein-tyrosine phosphatase
MAASSATPQSNAPANANFSASAAAAASNVTVIRYFINDEIAKHRVRVIGEANVGSFSQLLKTQHKLSLDFAIFMFDQAENRLRVLKDSTPIYGTPVYYVLENSRIDDLYRKVEKRVKKDLAALSAVSGKTATWNSENNPLRVDFIPDNELYLSEAGRIGLCMCPGRKKKKTAHEWDRDLDKDLLRIRDHYKCDVVVSLVRRSELVELKIPTLLEEVEKLGMESIHFPIKDKWIPESMAGVINLVDTLINRLKIGKTIVIHCNGGKGRSGTVAVACMVAMGKRVVQSIDVVRKARSGTIRNPAQIFYVKRFKTAFKNYQKKKQALIEARGTALAPKDQEALAEQAASDPLLEAESDSDSEMSEAMASRKEEKAAEKARKEAEKSQEKARKEEERAAEKARKEGEKAEKAQEKAQEKAEKAQEKARKEEEKKKKTGTPARGSAEIDPAALSSSPIPFDVQNLTQSEEAAAEAKPGSGVAKRTKADKTPAGSASSSPNVSHVEKADKGTVPLVPTAFVAKAEENGSVQPPELSSPKRAASRRKSVKDGPKAQKTNVINTDDAMAGSD